MKLVFASNNQHKVKEVRKILPPSLEILSLKDIDCKDDLPETGSTIRSNAYQKARYIYEKFGENCFADDTGLEVQSLDNRPGVYSARFAGPRADAVENIKKLVIEMNGIANRSALFRTVIALIIDGKEYFFEGVVNGSIATEPRGNEGFGYDPVFIPEKSEITFAEMTDKEKNIISHRAIALNKLSDFLIANN